MECITAKECGIRSASRRGHRRAGGAILLLALLVWLQGQGCSLERIPGVQTWEVHIMDAHVEAVSTDSALVVWTTDFESWSCVTYSDGESFSNTVFNDERVLHHEIRLENLAAGRTYALEVRSGADTLQEYAVGADLTFTTSSTP